MQPMVDLRLAEVYRVADVGEAAEVGARESIGGSESLGAAGTETPNGGTGHALELARREMHLRPGCFERVYGQET